MQTKLMFPRALRYLLAVAEHKSFTRAADALCISQPTLSQQLGVLRGEGLVEARREGKNVYYSLADDRVERMLPVLYELFCKR